MSKRKKPPVAPTAPDSEAIIEDLPVPAGSDADVKGGVLMMAMPAGEMLLQNALQHENRKFTTLSNAAQMTQDAASSSIDNTR